MPLFATRKNSELFTFSHDGEWFDFDFIVTDPKTIDYFIDYPNGAVVRSKDGNIKEGKIESGEWIQVDHNGESAYLVVTTSGWDRFVVSFDAPLTFSVRKEK